MMPIYKTGWFVLVKHTIKWYDTFQAIVFLLHNISYVVIPKKDFRIFDGSIRGFFWGMRRIDVPIRRLKNVVRSTDFKGTGK